MNAYVLSRDTEQDLDELWDYIADESVDAADRLLGQLFEAFEELAQFPSMGHARKDLTSFPVLFWPVGNYLISSNAEPNRECCPRTWEARRAGVPSTAQGWHRYYPASSMSWPA